MTKPLTPLMQSFSMVIFLILVFMIRLALKPTDDALAIITPIASDEKSFIAQSWETRDKVLIT